MQTNIQLTFNKTENNKPITDIAEDRNFINLIYPEPGLAENGAAQAWREENYGARYLDKRYCDDYGDEIKISLYTENGAAYSFFKHLATKYPTFTGKVQVENRFSHRDPTWLIENGKLSPHFDDVYWTENDNGLFIDYRITPAQNDLTEEDEKIATKYHNAYSYCAQCFVYCEFRYGEEILSEAVFYYSDVDEDNIHLNPAYEAALNDAKNQYEKIRSKIFTITRGDNILFTGDRGEFKKFIDAANSILE